LTNGGAFGLGFNGASTHCRAISRVFSMNQTLNTLGKLLSVSEILQKESMNIFAYFEA